MRPSGKTKQEIVAEFRCAEILTAARKVFAEKGFSRATVEEIAAVAGVAKGTLYLYFASKREIYLAAFRNGVTELVEASRRNVEQAEGLREKLRAFIQTRVEGADRDRDFFKIYHAEFGNIAHPAASSDWLLNLYQEQLTFLEAILRAAMQRGEIRELPAGPAAAAIYEMTRGVLLQHVLGWSKGTVEADVETLMEVLWSGIGNS